MSRKAVTKRCWDAVPAVARGHASTRERLVSSTHFAAAGAKSFESVKADRKAKRLQRQDYKDGVRRKQGVSGTSHKETRRYVLGTSLLRT